MKFARTTEVKILRSENGALKSSRDIVAIEEPLEMYIAIAGEKEEEEPFAITMRTPGHDKELITGFLFSEGIITDSSQIDLIEDNLLQSYKKGLNSAVKVWLKPGISFDPAQLKRNVFSTSGCGFCGRISMPPIPFPTSPGTKQEIPDSELITALPAILRKGQILFSHTGGIHAAALLNREGLLIDLFEDVGRHNAMDKLVGHALHKNQLPFSDYILCFSGRVGYELIQKAVMTRVQVVVSIGAPSSLAIELAQLFKVTLIGFTKADRFNVYNAPTSHQMD